ncbi:MAG: YciI family protein [Anaerolineae bacterium]|nr:YciI family protein [Gemmatimonadaceae bacterium]
MRYMLLIYDNEKEWANMSEAESGSLYAEYGTFTESIAASGNLVHGDPLEPTPTATTVRVRNGKTQTTDGPFAETREQLGGFYIVEAKDLDEAIAIAVRIPSARIGSIEIRPVMQLANMAPGGEQSSAQRTNM